MSYKQLAVFLCLWYRFIIELNSGLIGSTEKLTSYAMIPIHYSCLRLHAPSAFSWIRLLVVLVYINSSVDNQLQHRLLIMQIFQVLSSHSINVILNNDALDVLIKYPYLLNQIFYSPGEEFISFPSCLYVQNKLTHFSHSHKINRLIVLVKYKTIYS